jgi:Zn-dependent metalloprotease
MNQKKYCSSNIEAHQFNHNMEKKRFQLTILFLAFTTIILSQESIVDTLILNERKEVRIVKFVEGKYDTPENSSAALIKKYFFLSPQDELFFKSESTDDIGLTHSKYELYHAGIKVDQAIVIVHQKKGQVVIINGELPLISNLDVKPNISPERALEIALETINAKRYSWLDSKYSETNPHPELVIYHNYKNNQNTLAFKITIATLEPLDVRTIYIDAKTGNITKILDKQRNSNAIGTAYSRYSGTVNINTDSYSSGYRLFDGTRSQGIYTQNANRTDGLTVTDFSDNDNSWSEYDNYYMDNAALDAHYAAEKTYDYFATKFGRLSYDNQGKQMVYYLHYGLNMNNAVWLGWPYYLFAIGDGDGSRYSPFSACDAIAHEFGHAVTDYYGNLTYSSESGAIDEGLASIWGACVENFACIPGDQVWFEGERHWLDTNHPINFADPNLSHFHEFDNPQNPEHPFTDKYHGTNWYSGSDDYYGVHYNSTIASHWFYLLSQGRADTNEDNINYVVSGIGIDAASNIVYHYYDYLTPNSDFSMLSFFTEYVATQLYGSYSNAAIQTWNAWYGVGIGPYEVPNLISGSYVICANNQATYSLPIEFQGQNITWSTTNNIHIISGQGTRVVTAEWDHNYSSGIGEITATYNHGEGNIVCEKEIWVGPLPTITISSSRLNPCLNYAHFVLATSSYGCPPDSYKWYINNQKVEGTSSTLSYVFDDTNWYDSQQFSIFCWAFTGSDSIQSNTINSFVMDCDQPISVSISGDEYVCFNDYGHWTSNISGGSGDYVCDWYINDEIHQMCTTLDYFFSTQEWQYSQALSIDLRVTDMVTEAFSDASTFNSYLDDCYRKGYSVKVDPNPATEYINVTVTETNNPEVGFSLKNKTIKKNPIAGKDETLTYSLIDTYGRTVFQKKTIEKSLKIPVSGYLPGIYHLIVLSSTGTLNKQIIITR